MKSLPIMTFNLTFYFKGNFDMENLERIVKDVLFEKSMLYQIVLLLFINICVD